MPGLPLISAVVLLLVASTTFAAGKGGSGFQCWTNHQGVRECGNVVPPEFAQGRTETVNKQGIVTKVDERAKSAAELAEEERKHGNAESRALDEKRKQEVEAQRRQEQTRYDRMIKASFFRERDIEDARGRKLTGISSSITLTETTIVKLEERLAKEEQRAAVQQRSAKTGTDESLKEREDLKKQISDKRAFIAAKEKEKQQVNEEYDAYLKRFRELNGGSAP